MLMSERQRSKFIRVNEEFNLVGSDEHMLSAKRLELLDEISKLREVEPEALDAGIEHYQVETSTRIFFDFSGSLQLPEIGYGEKARIKTVELWKASHPEEKVVGKHPVLGHVIIETE